MLPRLAAAVSRTMVRMRLFSSGIALKISIVRGTKVSSATSFVTSMELKKHISMSTKPSLRTFPVLLSMYCVAVSKTPVLRSPATAVMSEKSWMSTVLLQYPAYSESGGMMNIVITAATNEITNTGCERKKSAAFFTALFKSVPPENGRFHAGLPEPQSL